MRASLVPRKPFHLLRALLHDKFILKVSFLCQAGRIGIDTVEYISTSRFGEFSSQHPRRVLVIVNHIIILPTHFIILKTMNNMKILILFTVRGQRLNSFNLFIL